MQSSGLPLLHTPEATQAWRTIPPVLTLGRNDISLENFAALSFSELPPNPASRPSHLHREAAAVVCNPPIVDAEEKRSCLSHVERLCLADEK